MQRIRLTYAKTEALRYTGNLDMQKVWERTLRRARLALAYSQGFHPQPRIQQACPLPLGYLSRQEILDFWLESDCSLEEIQQAIHKALPPGINLLNLESIDPFAPAMQKLARSSLYLVILLDAFPHEELETRIDTVINSTTLPRERRGKVYDLRPLVEAITLANCPDGDLPHLLFRLSARDGATGRPDELLLAMGLNPFAARIERISVLFD